MLYLSPNTNQVTSTSSEQRSHSTVFMNTKVVLSNWTNGLQTKIMTGHRIKKIN